MSHSCIKQQKVLNYLSVLLIAFGLLRCQTPPKKNHVLLGNQYARDGLYREAVDSYQHAIATFPQNLTAHRNLGMVLVRIGNYKQAIRHLEEAMSYYKDNFDTNFYIAEAYRGEEQYADAIFHYQKALKVKPKDVKSLKALSWSFFKIRYYSEALQTVGALHKLAPDDAQAAIIMARTLLKLHRYKDALLTLRAARAEASEQNTPYFYSVEGDIYFEVGEIEKAGKLYRLAIKEQPLLAGALLGLGKCYLSYNKTKDAITYMERAVRIRPKLVEGLFLLGKAYETVDAEKSLKYYLHFRKQASTDPEYLGMLAEVKEKIIALKKERRQQKRL